MEKDVQFDMEENLNKTEKLEKIDPKVIDVIKNSPWKLSWKK